jgi:hypothetical protein
MPFEITDQVRLIYRECMKSRTTNHGVVFAISRFDNNDDTLCYFFSQSYVDGISSVLMPFSRRFVKFQRIKRGQLRARDNPFGGHAEEKFIEYLVCSGRIPKSIELFISKIPCCAQSDPWEINYNGMKIELPVGCGNKLQMIIRLTPFIQWAIAYDEEYDGQMQVNCMSIMEDIKKLKNVTVEKINVTYNK